MIPLIVAELVPLAPAVKSTVTAFSGGAFTITGIDIAPFTVVSARPLRFSLATTDPDVGPALVPLIDTVGVEAPSTDTEAEIEISAVYHFPAGTVASVPVVVLVEDMISSALGAPTNIRSPPKSCRGSSVGQRRRPRS